MSKPVCLMCGGEPKGRHWYGLIERFPPNNLLHFCSEECRDAYYLDDAPKPDDAKVLREVLAAWPEINEECHELHVVAMNWIDHTIKSAREAGKYGPYSWLKETKLRQVMRVAAHLNTYLQKKFGELPDDGEDDLAHAVTRLAFVGAMDDRDKQRPDEAGPKNA